jgi:hypothetical protein
MTGGPPNAADHSPRSGHVGIRQRHFPRPKVKIVENAQALQVGTEIAVISFGDWLQGFPRDERLQRAICLAGLVAKVPRLYLLVSANFTPGFEDLL